MRLGNSCLLRTRKRVEHQRAWIGWGPSTQIRAAWLLRGGDCFIASSFLLDKRIRIWGRCAMVKMGTPLPSGRVIEGIGRPLPSGRRFIVVRYVLLVMVMVVLVGVPPGRVPGESAGPSLV